MFKTSNTDYQSQFSGVNGKELDASHYSLRLVTGESIALQSKIYLFETFTTFYLTIQNYKHNLNYLFIRIGIDFDFTYNYSYIPAINAVFNVTFPLNSTFVTYSFAGLGNLGNKLINLITRPNIELQNITGVSIYSILPFNIAPQLYWG